MATGDVDRQLVYLGLDELAFDPENPRLPSHHQGATEQAAIEWLLDRANLLDLIRSIGQQDFFIGEPILVAPRGDGTFKVIEGNRRYGACLLLNHPDKATTKTRAVASVAAEAEYRPSRIPALVFDHEDEVLGMLGYRHITGIQEWGPLAKAKYLQRLWESTEGPDEYHARLRFIARKIGSKSDYVARLMTALALYEVIASEDFYGIKDLNEATLSFSLLVLAMNRPDVANFIGLEDGQDFGLNNLIQSELKQLVHWFFEKFDGRATVLQESRNMSQLVEILNHPVALAALRTPGTSLADARGAIEAEGVSVSSRLMGALEQMVRASDLLAGGSAVAARQDLAVLDELTHRCSLLRADLLAALA